MPHGGTEVPEPVRPLLLLSDEELRYYCDPCTRVIFGYQDRAAAYIDTPVSRMVVDLNRPPLPLPLRDPDGIIKTRTIDGREVYRPGLVPDMHLIHSLLMNHYFPFHQRSMSSSTSTRSGSPSTAIPCSRTGQNTRRMPGKHAP